jgi:hypothetical protein
MIAWIMTKLDHVPTRGSQEAKMVFHIMLRRLTQGVLRMLRLCSGSAQALLRLCSGMLRLCSGCSAATQVKAAVAHVRRLKRNQRKGKLTLSLGVFD